MDQAATSPIDVNQHLPSEEGRMNNLGNSPRGMSDNVAAVAKMMRKEVPDCLASGVVDMSTGMLLTFETTDNHPSEVLDLLAGATLDLFQGRTVTMIEDIFKERRGVTSS